MKPRLIDANDVIEILEFYETDWDGISWAIRKIKELPTAYDVDKVVEQLEVLHDLVRTDQMLAVSQAIEIVENGGKSDV